MRDGPGSSLMCAEGTAFPLAAPSGYTPDNKKQTYNLLIISFGSYKYGKADNNDII